MSVVFPSGDLKLEGCVTGPASCTRGAVICHPHPHYGGDMMNRIVCVLADALAATGLATLRFNFRGVGKSTGEYDAGIGEVEDARAAARYLRKRSGATHLTMAGFSFGAMVALRAGAAMDDVERLIAVAPPISFFDLGFLAECQKEKVFIAGSGDQYCPLPRLRTELDRVADPKVARVIAGADHFLVGHERAVGEAARRACGADP